MDAVSEADRWLAQVDDVLVQAVGPVTELLQTFDGMIAESEQRTASLKAARRKAARVESALHGEPQKPGPKGPRRNGSGTMDEERRQKIGLATRERHVREREVKKTKLRELVVSKGPGVDLAGVDLLDEFNADLPSNDPALRLGRSLVVELMRELRDEGTLRLDHTANGGKALYRLVAAQE